MPFISALKRLLQPTLKNEPHKRSPSGDASSVGDQSKTAVATTANVGAQKSEDFSTEYSDQYTTHLKKLKGEMEEKEAFEEAVGGDFITVGKIELAVLRKYGFTGAARIIDVGCGSGRLALQLAAIPNVSYLGTDVLPDLLRYARKLVKRPDWSFTPTEGTSIPAADESADFITFFSVFTHISQEDCYRYLGEAKRVIRPGGKILVSFLEFYIVSHWAAFEGSLKKRRPGDPMNLFIDRDAIRSWAHYSGLEVVEFVDGDKPLIELNEEIHWANGQVQSGFVGLGQSLAVLVKKQA